MKKVKLPRKRKKRFIRELGKSEYLMMVFLNEMDLFIGRKNGERFYAYKLINSQLKIIKRF